jgi:hypothetical protein
MIGIALWALIPGFIAKKKGRSFWGYFFLSFVITPLITMIITIFLSNLNRVVEPVKSIASTTTSTSSNTDEDVVTPDTIPPRDRVLLDSTISPKVRYCRKCGFQLLAESDFCSHCGTKVIEARQA